MTLFNTDSSVSGMLKIIGRQEQLLADLESLRPLQIGKTQVDEIKRQILHLEEKLGNYRGARRKFLTVSRDRCEIAPPAQFSVPVREGERKATGAAVLVLIVWGYFRAFS
jgi:hypothetical protein